MIKNNKASLSKGIEIIKNELLTIPNKSGIYQMIGENSEYLYIGKAKNLNNRIKFYTQPKRLNSRLSYMVSNTVKLEIIVTSSEIEALLLESNLIKKFEPIFNILLKDDKSFSSILFNLSHSFPQLSAHRGQRNIKGDYFGPFVSKKTVQKTIETLQKIFLLRTCNDNIFKSRTRPCLQFQIKRCSAPCVNLISKESYRDSLNEAKKFLQGNSKSIKQNLIKKMYDASNKQNFEAAAIFRNRIKALTDVNASQNINVPNVNDVDFLVLRKIENKVVIQMTIVRSGCNYGSKSYFPSPGKNGTDVLEEEIMQAFICQFYDKNIPPENILVNLNPKDKSLIEELLLKKHKIKGLPIGLEHGTVTAVLSTGSFEITTLRTDITTDGRRAKVEFGTDFKKDAERRDFTINAMSQNKEGKLYDYFSGVQHIQKNEFRLSVLLEKELRKITYEFFAIFVLQVALTCRVQKKQRMLLLKKKKVSEASAVKEN